MKVRVGCGGSSNFLQHRGSPRCLKAEKWRNSKPKASQMKTINSYFTKATQGGTSSEQNQAQNGGAPDSEAVPHPRSFLLMPGLPHEPFGESRTKPRISARPDQGPDAHALALLADITRAAQELPSHIPEAEEHEDMARVVLAGWPEDPSEAWGHLDHGLNRLLGYDVDIEDIAHRVRRGPLGVEGLTRYIHGFVVDYSVPGGLLEGKLEKLSKAIEFVNQYVLVWPSE